jgi:hypothetical protein
LCELLELRVSLDIVTDLQGSETDVERADDLVVLRRRSGREIVGRATGVNQNDQQQANRKGEVSWHHS